MTVSKTPPKRARAPRRKKATVADLRAAARDNPLIGLTAAAKVLHVAPPNISRLRTQGRMPVGIEVEGTAMVYVRSEVEALAKELESERSGRT